MQYEIVNAVISSVSFDTERGLSLWIMLEYGDSTFQGFGGYLLYSPKGWKSHTNQFNYCGHFIWRILEIAGVSDFSNMAGKTIRVKREAGFNGKIKAIGHIIKDDWFDPELEFNSLKDLDIKDE